MQRWTTLTLERLDSDYMSDTEVIHLNFFVLHLCQPGVYMQVTSFIREESRENMQIIVISLKEEFFSKADALLGVYSVVNI